MSQETNAKTMKEALREAILHEVTAELQNRENTRAKILQMKKRKEGLEGRLTTNRSQLDGLRPSVSDGFSDDKALLVLGRKRTDLKGEQESLLDLIDQLDDMIRAAETALASENEALRSKIIPACSSQRKIHEERIDAALDGIEKLLIEWLDTCHELSYELDMHFLRGQTQMRCRKYRFLNHMIELAMFAS